MMDAIGFYLEKTKNFEGTIGRNVRVKWLEIAGASDDKYIQQLVDYENNPVTDAQGNKTFQYQQASARLYGGEASVDIHPKDWGGLQWNNSLSMVTGSNALGPLPQVAARDVADLIVRACSPPPG